MLSDATCNFPFAFGFFWDKIIDLAPTGNEQVLLFVFDLVHVLWFGQSSPFYRGKLRLSQTLPQLGDHTGAPFTSTDAVELPEGSLDVFTFVDHLLSVVVSKTLEGFTMNFFARDLFVLF